MRGVIVIALYVGSFLSVSHILVGQQGSHLLGFLWVLSCFVHRLLELLLLHEADTVCNGRQPGEHIAKELALDDATSQKFVETFCEYQKEVWALSPRAKRPEMKDGKKPEMKDWKKAEKTDAEVEKAIQERFEHSQKILTIRENYYKKYRKFLSPKQVQRVYELEKKGMNRLRQGMKRGKMGMKPGKQGFKNGKPRMGKHNHSKKGNQQPAENSQP